MYSIYFATCCIVQYVFILIQNNRRILTKLVALFGFSVHPSIKGAIISTLKRNTYYMNTANNLLFPLIGI